MQSQPPRWNAGSPLTYQRMCWLKLNKRLTLGRIKSMTIAKNSAGAWIITDIIAGYLCKGQYYFCTKKEALQMFREEHQRLIPCPY
jgi:hypothetical protein